LDALPKAEIGAAAPIPDPGATTPAVVVVAAVVVEDCESV